MLEIGAGEGFALKFFSDMGWNVKGIDFSDFGCASHNPDMLCHLEVGDIFEILANKIVEKECFDVVWMDNVLEHALNPEDLLEKCKLVAKPGSILIVEVPNDFSVIQKYLIKSGRIPSEYWVSMPDHISYFSRDSLKNLCASTGWKECMALADFPIDIALLNIETNYIADKSKGKSCHNWRVEVDFLIHQSDTEKVVRFYQSLLDIGLGRCILGFYKFM